MGVKQTGRNMAVTALLMLFVGYQALVMSLMHVHFINGVQLVHFHPFADTHSHTEESLLVIGNIVLGGDSQELDAPMLPLPYAPFFITLSFGQETVVPTGDAVGVPSLRAPPFMG